MNYLTSARIREGGSSSGHTIKKYGDLSYLLPVTGCFSNFYSEANYCNNCNSYYSINNKKQYSKALHLVTALKKTAVSVTAALQSVTERNRSVTDIV
jgi:hypothetical protein